MRTSTGAEFFLKCPRGAVPIGIFDAEANALAALEATNALRVPGVIACHDSAAGADGPRWLLLEWLEPGHPYAATWHQLGLGLARLHGNRAPRPGWDQDNFIGTLTQANAPENGWADFWRLRRLQPQLRSAVDAGAFDRAELRRFDALSNALDEILAPAAGDGFSLLHGDLWSGNLHVLRDGGPALVDPACSYGHREVDLAMTRLFGGFEDAFYAVYREASPLEPGVERRLPVYQLYYLLVHVNLFGRPYRAGTLEALRSAGF